MKQMQQKYYYDKSATPLKPLQIGEPIRIQQRNLIWKPAVSEEKHNDRSYSVRTPAGAQYCRNRKHLLKTYESPMSGSKMTNQFLMRNYHTARTMQVLMNPMFHKLTLY